MILINGAIYKPYKRPEILLIHGSPEVSGVIWAPTALAGFWGPPAVGFVGLQLSG